VLTTPAKSLTAIHVQAHKKYLLAAILCPTEVRHPDSTAAFTPPQTGLEFPKHTPAVVGRSLERYTVPYINLARAFKEGPQELQKHIEQCTEQLLKASAALQLQGSDVLGSEHGAGLAGAAIVHSSRDPAPHEHVRHHVAGRHRQGSRASLSPGS
jgi:hypothetical protein